MVRPSSEISGEGSSPGPSRQRTVPMPGFASIMDGIGGDSVIEGERLDPVSKRLELLTTLVEALARQTLSGGQRGPPSQSAPVSAPVPDLPIAEEVLEPLEVAISNLNGSRALSGSAMAKLKSQGSILGNSLRKFHRTDDLLKQT